MALKSRATLKTYFEANDNPTESQFGDLIDSIPNFVDDNPTFGFNWKGAWDNTIRYVKYDSVYYEGASYVCIKAHDAGHPPTETEYWSKISERGADAKVMTSIAFAGDDLVFTFDDGSTETIVGAKNDLTGPAGYTPVKGVDYFDGEDGVVQAIVEGTNIVVDNTDPANPVVSFELGPDENFVSDDELIVLQNTAGVNTGDQTRDSLGLDTDDSPQFAGIKLTTGAGLGKVLTSDADGDATWETPSAGGADVLQTQIFS